MRPADFNEILNEPKCRGQARRKYTPLLLSRKPRDPRWARLGDRRAGQYAPTL